MPDKLDTLAVCANSAPAAGDNESSEWRPGVRRDPAPDPASPEHATVSFIGVASRQSPLESRLLTGTAVFIFAWIVARASIQSITIDEADTYLAFVARPSPSHWEAAANNHVLNSLLMRLSTVLFGVSQLSVRIPALIGAGIYIWAAVTLVRLITTDGRFRWFLLICLTGNPFVMDHLVAARGYSLALAFLLSAIALAASYVSEQVVRDPRRLYWRCAICSISCGLSFSANFSFALVDATTLLLCSVWLGGHAAAPHESRYRRLETYAKVLLASCIPGMLVALFITGSVLLDWPRGSLVWGATSLKDTVRSVSEASLFQPNQYLLNPVLHSALLHCSRLLFPMLGIACAFRLICLVAHTGRFNDPRARFLLALCSVGGGAAGLAMCLHYLLFRTLHVLLPFDRTAVFLAPLLALFAGALAAIPTGSVMGVVSRRLNVAAIAIVSLYFLGCFRLTYFKTWQFDADVKNAYSALAFYNLNYGVTSVSSNWRYVAALNFYRASSRVGTPAEIPNGPPVVGEYPPGKDAYVLFRPWDQPFIDRQCLKVVYYDAITGVAVAVTPELDTTPRHAILQMLAQCSDKMPFGVRTTKRIIGRWAQGTPAGER
ncbi:MAG: hypothetical protein ACLQU1_18375 [Bryobacteraceae bacterium]